MSGASASPLRIAVIGGGPAGSFFALYALKYARLARRDIAITIYEAKDFRRFGQPGCNMCAGIIPTSVLRRFGELDLKLPAAIILNHINTYSLHTTAGTLNATQPDADADIVSVYRGVGPRYGHPPDLMSFDELLLEQALTRGVKLRRALVQEVRRGQANENLTRSTGAKPIEVVSDGEGERYDLVVLATGVNSRLPDLRGFGYRPPPTGPMCQIEFHLGSDEVQRRLGASVHIFLPPDEVATYGILIPKGPFVAVSLLHARNQMRSLHQFLALDEVTAVLGTRLRPVCGCLPKISVGLARSFVDDGLVAIGDASATRLYKNGIGSALATAERAAWTAVHRGCSRSDFAASYVPLCHTIDADNWIGRLLFLEVPVLKRVGVMPRAHHRLATGNGRQREVSELHTRILWGMFTGAYSYRDLLRMATSPNLVIQLALALGRSIPERAREIHPHEGAT